MDEQGDCWTCVCVRVAVVHMESGQDLNQGQEGGVVFWLC